MIYTAADFTDDTIAALTSKGYTVCECDDGFWFTWARPDGRGDVEVGETYSSVHSAWFDALLHWLNNTEIEFDEQAWAPPGRRAEDNPKRMKTFEVTAAGFDASTDETDDRVYWVKAAYHEEVIAAIQDTGATYHDTIDTETDIDFTLPRDRMMLASALLKWASVERNKNRA